jgi:hypothetical protein
MTTGLSLPSASASALHRVGRAEQIQRPVGPQLVDLVGHLLHRRVHRLRIGAMSEHQRTALVEVGGGEAHREAEANATALVALCQSRVHAARRLHHRALRVQRQQERQPRVVRRPGPSVAPQLGQQRGAARAGFRAVDVRIGAVRAHRAGMLQHAAGDVGVQVEAGQQRHRGPDRRAQPLQQFAFGIVDMLGHRSAVQVEVDRVEAAAPRVADDVLGDALEGLAGDMRRRAGAGPGRGYERPAALPRCADEAAHRQAGAAQPIEHRRAAAEGREGRAAFEGGPVGPARGEGVGLVLEAGDEDAHRLGGRRVRARS